MVKYSLLKVVFAVGFIQRTIWSYRGISSNKEVLLSYFSFCILLKSTSTNMGITHVVDYVFFNTNNVHYTSL